MCGRTIESGLAQSPELKPRTGLGVGQLLDADFFAAPPQSAEGYLLEGANRQSTAKSDEPSGKYRVEQPVRLAVDPGWLLGRGALDRMVCLGLCPRLGFL